MATCPKCGNEIPDNAKFCSHCGAPIAAGTAAGEAQQTVDAAQQAAGEAQQTVDAAQQAAGAAGAAEGTAQANAQGQAEQSWQQYQQQNNQSQQNAYQQQNTYQQQNAYQQNQYQQNTQQNTQNTQYGQYQQGDQYRQQSQGQQNGHAFTQYQPNNSENAKVASILCYWIGFIGWLIAFCISDRKDPYVKSHLNQSLVINLFGLITWIPILGWIWGIFILICRIIGTVNAAQDKNGEVPLIGKIHMID